MKSFRNIRYYSVEKRLIAVNTFFLFLIIILSFVVYGLCIKIWFFNDEENQIEVRKPSPKTNGGIT